MKKTLLSTSIAFLAMITSIILIPPSLVKAEASMSCKLYVGDNPVKDLTNQVGYSTSLSNYYNACENKLNAESLYSGILSSDCSKYSGKAVVGYVVWEGRKYATSFTKTVVYTPAVTRTFSHPPSPIDGYRSSYKVEEQKESCYLK
jgi:hypothetical protein